MDSNPLQFNLKDAPLYPAGFQDKISSLVSGNSNLLPAGLSHNLLLGIFIVFFVAYCAVSAVLMYHWDAYGMRNKLIIFAGSVFVTVSVVLLWSAFVLIS